VALQNIHCDGVAWIGLFQDRVQSGSRSVRVLTGNVKGLSSVIFCRLLSCVAFAISVISSFVSQLVPLAFCAPTTSFS
jgi:hypothetical protein